VGGCRDKENLNLSTTWRWMVSLILRSLYPGKPTLPLNKAVCAPEPICMLWMRENSALNRYQPVASHYPSIILSPDVCVCIYIQTYIYTHTHIHILVHFRIQHGFTKVVLFSFPQHYRLWTDVRFFAIESIESSDTVHSMHEYPAQLSSPSLSAAFMCNKCSSPKPLTRVMLLLDVASCCNILTLTT